MEEANERYEQTPLFSRAQGRPIRLGMRAGERTVDFATGLAGNDGTGADVP